MSESSPRRKNDEEPSKKELIEKAKDALRHKHLSPRELLSLAKTLKAISSFTFARRLLKVACEHPSTKSTRVNLDLNESSPEILANVRMYSKDDLSIERNLYIVLHQQYALCTYKDTDLPAISRLGNALEILRHVVDIKQSVSARQETFGLMGAVYKRRWEIGNRRSDLECSLEYYEKGYRLGARSDLGYTGINAAFVLDLLADQESRTISAGTISEIATGHRNRADAIRQDIVKTLDSDIDPETPNWWLSATIAEAYFGQQKYPDAIRILGDAKDAKIKAGGSIEAWELESTLTQLARLSQLHIARDGPRGKQIVDRAWDEIAKKLDVSSIALEMTLAGKVGLALSGGGFRASLYHIGTLAKLAELDVLRRIEVISCVSGGSVIGAYFYLKVRELLNNNPDRKVTKEDYIEIVEQIAEGFLAGVQRNLLVRAFSNIRQNLRMFVTGRQSRTKRIAGLYEEEFYSKLTDDPLFMDELNIYPESDSDFSPKSGNWKRVNKVPMLFINCTALNTGHNWQFTTTWMGEPPVDIDSDVDMNDVLRRLYYWEAPERHKKIKLGEAVAASTCVPGLFEPLTLEGLYEERIVRLVDGGVCDNQGISSLLEQECQIVLVSDGSGQGDSQKTPSGGTIGVLSRCFNVFQARIRDAQFKDLEARLRSYLIRGLMFIHLKKGLDREYVGWIGEEKSVSTSNPERTGVAGEANASFGISKALQKRLAGIRTHLDSFSDVEACALMTSGYLMTEEAFGKDIRIEGIPRKCEREEWGFLQIEKDLGRVSAEYDHVIDLLSASGQIAFKIWQQNDNLRRIRNVLAVFLVVLMPVLVYLFADAVLIENLTLGGVGVSILLAVLFYALSSFAIGKYLKWIKWKSAGVKILFLSCVALIGCGIARIHLRFFDKMFLSKGSLDRFTKLRKKEEN